MEAQTPEFFDSPDGDRLAYHVTHGVGPGVIFLGGFRSDMTGTKAIALEHWCKEQGRAFLRFDYFGHGQSPGKFEEGTISRWKMNALAMLDGLTKGPQILVGSSMGGWVKMLVARERQERIHALVGIAAAPDFTEDLMWAIATQEQKSTLLRDRILYQPSEYSDVPTPISYALIEDGRNHFVLRERFSASYPIRLLHGMRDPDVPWQRSQMLAEIIDGPDTQVLYQPAADHRFSSDQDIALLLATVGNL